MILNPFLAHGQGRPSVFRRSAAVSRSNFTAYCLDKFASTIPPATALSIVRSGLSAEVFSPEQASLQRSDPVEKQHPVQVVHLVLDRHRLEAARPHFPDVAIAV